MERKVLKLPYLLSAAVLIAVIVISAFTGWGTENTVWGMLSFVLVCLPSFIVSICNVRICKKQGQGLRFLFYVLIFVLGVWILFSILFCIFALLNGFMPLV